jgi:ABC-2 type transport system permease protein
MSATLAMDRLAFLAKPLLSLIWSVRREIWEHRFLIAAPLGVAALVLAGFVIGWPFGFGTVVAQQSAKSYAGIWQVYDVCTFLCMVSGLVAALFYCLDALHGERRDRSILFWKSLPVSDSTTVLSKLCVPMVVIPAVVFAAAFLLCSAILLVSSAMLAAEGHVLAAVWRLGPFLLRFSCLSYALIVSALWYVPVYCALLLVSVWARHVPFLWAALPLVLIGVADRLVFHGHRAGDFYLYRLFGWFEEAWHLDKAGLPVARDTGRLLSSPGLWLGLAVAVLLFAAAVRLRRRSSLI